MTVVKKKKKKKKTMGTGMFDEDVRYWITFSLSLVEECSGICGLNSERSCQLVSMMM
jgi:hypothetical protein